jgi:uncharacterized membrane protein YadS
VLWAILIGLVISNLLTIPKLFLPGTATYEFWLKRGVVLLGGRKLTIRHQRQSATDPVSTA